MDNDEYMTSREAAALLRVAPQTLALWRCRRKGPPWVKPGGRVLYRREAVLAWLEERAAAAR